MNSDTLQRCRGFEWDEGNRLKSERKHAVSWQEAEEVFTHRPLIVAEDAKHSAHERRYFALGRTKEERWLYVVFTFRGDYIRVISARSMNRKERGRYEQEIETHS